MGTDFDFEIVNWKENWPPSPIQSLVDNDDLRSLGVEIVYLRLSVASFSELRMVIEKFCPELEYDGSTQPYQVADAIMAAVFEPAQLETIVEINNTLVDELIRRCYHASTYPLRLFRNLADRSVVPVAVPASWPVWNAPRPLYGDVTWQGNFIEGIYYAAIHPAGYSANDFFKMNRSLDACLIQYVSPTKFEGLWRDWLTQFCIDNGYDMEGLTLRELRDLAEDKLLGTVIVENNKNDFWLGSFR